VGVALAGLLAAAAGGPISQVVVVAGTGLLVELAAALAGGLAGFLFGIPRSIARNDPGPERRYDVNTNLEQISDWLTKILVGVGLVQIGQLGAVSAGLFNAIAQDMKIGTTAVGALILYSLTAGFLGSYLVTRTVLTRTFSAYDRLSVRVDQVEQLTEQLSTRVTKDAQTLAAIDAVLGGDEGAATEDELETLFADASPSVLAQVFARANAQRRANWRNNKVAMARTIPVFRALSRVDKERRYHRHFGQLGYALHDQAPPDWAGAEAALTEAITIRNNRKQAGFGLYELIRAISRIAMDSSQGESPDATKVKVLADLTAAARDSRVRRLGLLNTIPEIASWLARNNLSLDSLTSSS
jgi:hypothetical protein